MRYGRNDSERIDLSQCELIETELFKWSAADKPICNSDCSDQSCCPGLNRAGRSLYDPKRSL